MHRLFAKVNDLFAIFLWQTKKKYRKTIDRNAKLCYNTSCLTREFSIRRGIEVVITRRSWKPFVRKGAWVRIPPSPVKAEQNVLPFLFSVKLWRNFLKVLYTEKRIFFLLPDKKNERDFLKQKLLYSRARCPFWNIRKKYWTKRKESCILDNGRFGEIPKLAEGAPLERE